MHADAHGQPPIKPPQPATWREAIFELSAHERPSASDGERRAAESIAARLHALGCPAVVEQERAHGGYWWPLGLANLAALGGALLVSGQRPGPLRRAAAVLASGVAAAALWDDLGHGRRWFRRALLPRRPTWNVIAQAGDRMTPERMPPRTVVLIAHHDSAHSGLVFHPALGRIPPRFFPRTSTRTGLMEWPAHQFGGSTFSTESSCAAQTETAVRKNANTNASRVVVGLVVLMSLFRRLIPKSASTRSSLPCAPACRA